MATDLVADAVQAGATDADNAGGLRWEDLFRKGVLVCLHICCWRAKEAITPEDLGIVSSVAATKIKRGSTLGSHRLAPASAFQAINDTQYRAKDAIERYGISFEENVVYVSNENAPKLFEELRLQSERRRVAVDAFVSNYAKVRAEAIPQICASLGELCRTPEAADAALERVRAAYPSADQVAGKFRMWWTVRSYASAQDATIQAAAGAGVAEITAAVGGMVQSLRNDLRERVAKVIELAREGGRLNKRTVEATTEALDRAEDLNKLVRDAVLTSQIWSIRQMLVGSNEKGVDMLGVVPELQRAADALAGDVKQATENALAALTGKARRIIG